MRGEEGDIGWKQQRLSVAHCRISCISQQSSYRSASQQEDSKKYSCLLTACLRPVVLPHPFSHLFPRKKSIHITERPGL
jgi:hypothetical protein